MSPRFRWLVLAVWAVLFAGPARAQDQTDPLDRYAGRTIVGVEIRIEGKVDTTAPLASLNDIKPGEPLSLPTIRRVSDRLLQIPRFEDLEVSIEERPGGVLLVYNLTPRHPVTDLEFIGDTGITADELTRLVREEFNGMPTTTPPVRVERAVAEILRQEGYFGATARATPVRLHDPDRAILRIDVAAGRRTTIAAVDWRGRSPLDRRRLEARLGVAVGAPYRRRALDAALADVRQDLRSQKFYTAVAQAAQPKFSDDLSQVVLIINVDAGPLVELQVHGPLPGREEDLIPFQRLGAVDEDLLENARDEIDAEWRARGYWKSTTTFASATADSCPGTTPSPTTPSCRIITFTIDRGQRHRIVRIDWPADLQLEKRDRDSMKWARVNEWFNQDGIEHFDLFIVMARYQERGFHRVKLDPRYEVVPGPNADEVGVIVHPNISVGPQGIVRAIAFDLGEGPAVSEAELLAASGPDSQPLMRARVGAPFVLGDLSQDREAIENYLSRRGYLNRSVLVTHTANEAGTDIQLTVRVRAGVRVRVGEIIVVGNRNISREQVLREMTLAVGDFYSPEARAESETRLYRTTSYDSARISAEPLLPGESEIRLVVAVVEAKRTPFGFGPGLEGGTHPRTVEGGVEDRLEFAPRAFIELGRRNIGGGNRTLNTFARVSFKPKNAPGDPDQDGRGFGSPEYRATASYRERYAFGTNADIVVTGTAEQAIRTSYNFIRRFGTFEIFGPVSSRVVMTGRYTLEQTKLFDEAIPVDQQPLIDRLFPQVRLSILSTSVNWDRRDNAINTTRGEQFTSNVDFALEPLGSEVGFAKLFTQALFFRPISARPVVFAARAMVGVARGFSRTVPVLDPNGQPVLDQNGNPLTQVIEDIPASHRFFAGGSTSVRGFQLDRLGVAEILNESGLSNGGNALVVFNVEIRARVRQLFKRDLSVVGFVDTGNVFHRVSELDLSRLRTAVGLGVRYDSWLGPIRFDVGFKTDRLVFPNARERRWELHLSIGEVF